jgi:hypothetical protein
MPVRISLLHATYRRDGGPLAVRDAWIERADTPSHVEYICAMDADDDLAVAATGNDLRAVNEATSEVSSVRNWNSAAEVATGGLLMVIADDLFPPRGWDTALVDLTNGLDPDRTAFAVKVNDSPDARDTYLRHPVVSRAFYRQHGLFSPRYRGVYCDNDITLRAFWKSVILDGRSLVLEHRHPSVDPSIARSESQHRVSAEEEYNHGRELLVASWANHRRLARIRLVPTDRPLSAFRVQLKRWSYCTIETVAHPVRRANRRLEQLTGKLPGAANR